MKKQVDNKEKILKDFRTIPGVGKSVANDLYNLGYRSLEDIRGQDPEDMYRKLCEFQGVQIDRCMQYVFRCAVYYVSNEVHEPELLKWWNWKNKFLTIK